MFEMLVTVDLIRSISPARQIAFTVLESVYEGAYASDALLEKNRSLSSRDAGLAAQIVFGCLRYQGQLDYLIEYYSRRKISQLEKPIVLALRAAIYQLRYLERIPAHAAVDESVEYAKTHRRAAAGLVNAVLRKVNRKPVPWPDDSIRLSCPDWLLERWTTHFGRDSAQQIAAAALNEPESYIRIPAGAAMPADVSLAATDVAGCFHLLSPLPPGYRLHDIGSQSIVPLLDLAPGLSYLDLCAAPGNKTMQALETPLGSAIACDVSARRLADVPPICPRVVLDASVRLPFSRRFDRIFIDAPCSGTGTLSRNPEIKWRVQSDDLARFQRKQVRMVREALQLLAPGGKLLYSTCSLEVEENEQVIAAALSGGGGFRCSREAWRLPGRDEGDGFYAALLESASAG